MTTAGRALLSAKAETRDNDASFRSWTCAEGLACQPVATPRAWDVFGKIR